MNGNNRSFYVTVPFFSLTNLIFCSLLDRNEMRKKKNKTRGRERIECSQLLSYVSFVLKYLSIVFSVKQKHFDQPTNLHVNHFQQLTYANIFIVILFISSSISNCIKTICFLRIFIYNCNK